MYLLQVSTPTILLWYCILKLELIRECIVNLCWLIKAGYRGCLGSQIVPISNFNKSSEILPVK